MDWIEAAAPDRESSIIDVGGGSSTLVDDLLAKKYRNISVLDISGAALSATRKRLGPDGDKLHWIIGDVTRTSLPAHAYEIWHDRAVFHFLTKAEDQRAYVRLAADSLAPGGTLIMSIFGPDGPDTCSGLPVARYNADKLEKRLGACFELTDSVYEDHRTPSGGMQQFLYACFRRAVISP